MKKLIIGLLAASMCLCGFAAFSACKPGVHTHTYGDWQTVTEATCLTAGEKQRTCQNCDDKQKEEIPALGHDYKDGKCTRCGDLNYVPGTEGLEYRELCDENGTPIGYSFSGMGDVTETDIVIASQYNGLPVIRIGYTEEEAYEFLEDLQKKHESGELEGSYELQSFSLMPFFNMPLENIGVDTSNAAGLSLVTSVLIPDSVLEIGYWAFGECRNLTSVTIGNGVTVIGNSAFHYCRNLTSVTLGSKVTTIGERAFNNCKSLTNIVIPDSLTSIGYNGFSGCRSLTSISANENNTVYSSQDGILYNKEKTRIIEVPQAISGNVVIPDSMTKINYRTFSDRSSLEGVTIGNGVTEIGDCAFEDCSSLTSITIGSGVNEIGSEVFKGCNNFHKVNITDIEVWCKITFADNPLKYAKNLYINDELVTDLVIPDSVTSIGNSTFEGCSSLTSVVIPDSVTSIGNSTFAGCSSLTSVVIPDSVTSIGNSTFAGCNSLTSVVIPDSVISIGNSTFEGCSGLTSIVIPDSVTSTGNWMFKGCSNLTSVIIPDSVTSIGNNAFENCSNLISIVIPDSVTSIGWFAFLGCSSLTSIVIPDSVTSIGWSAFEGCKNLKYNEYDNAYYIGNSENPYMALMQAKDNSIMSCNIHPNTRIIADGAFYDCNNMTSIEIPDGVVSIGDDAFSGCFMLTCSVVIPDSVTSIGDSAFYNCTNMKSFVLGNSVASIGSYAFGERWHLRYYNEYDNAYYLGNSVNPFMALITAKDDSITSCNIHPDTRIIAGSAFRSCNSLTSIEIPDNVTSIGWGAFLDCNNLTSIVIPDSVTFIGNSMFEGCSGLTSIVIPDSVTSIGDYAFNGCNNLKDVYYTGTETDWKKITIKGNNVYLANATIHYNYKVEE